MKILHIDTEKKWRGGEQQLLSLVRGLIGRGIGSTVACRAREALEERCREEGIPTLALTGNQLFDALKVAPAARAYDILHAHAANAHTVAALSRVFHTKPVLYTRRVDYPLKDSRFTRWKYAKSDRIIAITREVRDVLQAGGIDGNDITVIYSSVDDQYETFVRPGEAERIRNDFPGRILVGTVGALTEQKNHRNFIDAAKIVLQRVGSAAFLIIGEGPLREQLENRIREEGLAGQVFLLGFKKHIPDYLKALDLLVLSSDYEGMGSILLAGMMLRIPVVSTDAGGAKEIVLDGATGMLVRKRDPAALARGIVTALEDGGLRRTITENAYRMVKEKFTASVMTDAYVRVYREMVSP